ncbi:MAG: Sec-independent protein translocase protein TatB [Pseudoxanthomonas sp.]
MFGISSGELFFIAIIALIVLGPERLPKVTRLAGMWVRRARNQWNSVKDELERELAAEELKRSLHDAQTALQETERKIRENSDQARREFEQVRASVQQQDDAPTVAAPASDDAPTAAQMKQEGESDEPRNA